MRIENFRLVTKQPSPKGFQVVAMFSVEVNDDITLFDFQLIKTPDGRLQAYPPKSPNGSVMAAISPTVRNNLASKAEEHYRDRNRAIAA